MLSYMQYQQSTQSLLSGEILPTFTWPSWLLEALSELNTRVNWSSQTLVFQGVSELERTWMVTGASTISIPQTMLYRILCNGTFQKSQEARSGLGLASSRCTSLHNNRYGVYLNQLYVLQRWYAFRGDRIEILRFLERYPFVVSLLVEAYYNIMRYFPRSLVFLTVVTDPEEFGADQLVASIATDLGPEEATEALSLFDKKWWLSSLRQAQGKLCITLEFP